MSLRTVFRAAGHWLKGLILKVDEEIQFDQTTNPEIDSQGGGFIWKSRTNEIQSFVIRDDVKAQNAVELDTTNDEFKILPPYKFSGISSIEGIGIFGGAIALGAWVSVSLGASHANKTVSINVVNTGGVTCTVGARSVGSAMVAAELVTPSNTTSFLVQTDGSGNVEIFKSAAGPDFYHRTTIN